MCSPYSFYTNVISDPLAFQAALLNARTPPEPIFRCSSSTGIDFSAQIFLFVNVVIAAIVFARFHVQAG